MVTGVQTCALPIYKVKELQKKYEFTYEIIEK